MGSTSTKQKKGGSYRGSLNSLDNVGANHVSRLVQGAVVAVGDGGQNLGSVRRSFSSMEAFLSSLARGAGATVGILKTTLCQVPPTTMNSTALLADTIIVEGKNFKLPNSSPTSTLAAITDPAIKAVALVATSATDETLAAALENNAQIKRDGRTEATTPIVHLTLLLKLLFTSMALNK
ncbi:hypothetical protein L7F22_022742 [Adiantum nelumboides]|nr:hypothetical protein [Adiantum nelumboides]